MAPIHVHVINTTGHRLFIYYAVLLPWRIIQIRHHDNRKHTNYMTSLQWGSIGVIKLFSN